MSRKLFEQHLNELSVISENFTFKHQVDYKLDILKKCLETLQSANYYVEIPYELLEKIDKIFKLIPSHPRYFVEIDRLNYRIYLNLIQELDEIVVKNYIGNIDEIKKHLKILVGNLSSIFLIYGFFSKFVKNRFEIVEKYYGYVCLIFIGLSLILFLYQRIKWVKMKHSNNN
jgi:hypothetical protein